MSPTCASAAAPYSGGGRTSKAGGAPTKLQPSQEIEAAISDSDQRIRP